MNKRVCCPINSRLRRHVAVLMAVCAMPFSAMGQYRVVAYYPGWLKTKLPANQIKFEHLTHINHAFAWPLADGSITGYSEIDDPELIAETHRAGKKILIALGGWGQSNGFSPMAADSTIRKKFVKNLVDYCRARGYDGADFDWEFPQNNADRANLTALIKEVRNAFDAVNPPLLLTMVGVASDYSGKWHDYAALAQYVGWVNVMTYDFHGSWSSHAGHNAPLYAPSIDSDGSVHTGIQYIKSRGVPKEKIHVGMPFYGKEFNAANLYGPSTGATDMEYSLIAPRLTSGWTYHWDDFAKVPYLTNASRTKLVTYDDSLSLSLKCEYAKTNGLGGVMIWAIGQDVFNNTQSLMEAVGRAMGKPTAIAEEKHGIAKSFALFDNYPNPFNAATTIEFQLNQAAPASLFVYDLNGNLVTVLQHGMAASGRNKLTWNAAGCPNGVYFYKLETAGFSETKRMTLVK